MADNTLSVAKQPSASTLQWSKRQQIKTNYDLAKWQAEFDYESEYNSPVNQLNRLYDAGINPLYNSEFSNSINKGDAATSPVDSGVGDLSAVGNQLLGIADFAKNKELANSTIRLQQSEAQKNVAEARKAGSESTINEIRSQYEAQSAIANLEAIVAEKGKNVAITEREYKTLAQMDAYLQNNINDIYTKYMSAAAQLYNAQINEFNAVTDRYTAQQNAGIGWYEANTHRKEYNLHTDQFQEALRMNNWSQVTDIIDRATSTIFGSKTLSANNLNELTEMVKGVKETLSNPFFNIENSTAKGHKMLGVPVDIAKGFLSVSNALDRLVNTVISKVTSTAKGMINPDNTNIEELENSHMYKE